MSSPRRPRWGPVRSLLCLAPVLVGVPLWAYRTLWALPDPVIDLVNPETLLPQISEAQVLAHAKFLSEEIGYRTVGTLEHALGDAWMLKQAEAVREQCEDAVKSVPGRKLECEVWHQQGSGTHRFDMMGKRLYKNYVNLTNIVVRVSDGTERGKEHAVLINAHVDSTLPSPGASDDAISVGVMLDCLRVLVNTPDWSPTHAIIFLFNNAEESLQDGSHLFSTQHPVAHTVRAAINLEAAGTTGPELLFQATSEQMIQAYAHVPRPFGTVVATEVFGSGIMLSDTDFRQFEEYLNVTGLDIAIVRNSYLYHMRKDIVENIQPGVAQHMAENTLALLQYLSSSESPLPTLTEGYVRPTTVFYELFGHFFVYSFHTALIVYSSVFAVSSLFVLFTFVPPAPALKHGRGVIGEQLKGMLAVSSAFVGSVVGANVVAVIMQRVLGKSLSWFSVELSALALYGPSALLGALLSQRIVGRVREQTAFTSILLLQTFLAVAGQYSGIGSSAVLFLFGAPLLPVLLLNKFITSPGDDVSLLCYALGQLIPLVSGTTLIAITLDVFVPLTGRMGGDAPAEHIIATIVAGSGACALPLVIPFTHRFGERFLTRAILLMTVVVAVAMSVFSMRSPFDTMHQKRLFMVHMENITSQEQHLHLATADGAPGFTALAEEIMTEFGIPGAAPTAVIMDEWNADWDVMYPFSAFLSPYKLDLPVKPTYLDAPEHNFVISAVNDTFDSVSGTRSFKLVIDHPGIIWTAIAFDAHVLKWNLDNNPPDEHARHHIKEASFYGYNTWSVDLVVKVPAENPRLEVSFVGIHEKAMWPGKRGEKELGGRAMALFEESDSWLEKRSGGTIDATMVGCVGGVSFV